MRILLTLLLFTLPALAPGRNACPDGLELERALFTTGIRDQEPVKAISRIPEGVPAVYFFTRITGGAGTRIRHLWFYDDVEVVSVPLRVGGDDWRTWSSKNLGLRRDRDWSVRVLGPQDCVLGSARLPASAPGDETLARIRELMNAGDLAGARMETRQALAGTPSPAMKQALETIIERDLVLARVEREIEQQSLYTARGRLEALLAGPLPPAQRERALVLQQRLEEAREALRNSATGRLADVEAVLRATLAGGRFCRRLNEELDQTLSALLGNDHSFLVTRKQLSGQRLEVNLLDRRSGDSHERVLSCLPSPLSPLPASPPSGD